MVTLVVLALLAAVNLAAAWKYPPLLVNTIALGVLLVVVIRELRRRHQPG